MARPFPSIRKPSAGWTGAVNYTLEDHIASPYPHPIYPRKDGVLPNDSITIHMSDAGAHRKYFLNTSELIFTKAEYEANKTRDGATITDPTTRESNLYQYLITAPALAAILADYNSSGGLGYESLVKEILGAPGSHTYTMCTAEDDIKAPSIGLFVELFDKFNAVVGILPNQSKPTAATPTALTSVFATRSHTHEVYDSHGASHNEIWAAINAGGGGGGSGGVIDGTLCTDAATGEPCVTEIELHDGTTPNNQASYTYTVQHNCLLFIQLKNAIIAYNESASVPRDCILVKAGEQVIGTLTDNLQDLWNDLDNDGLRIPVKVGTTITLVGDGTTPIFDGTSLTTDSKIVFSEFELTPLSMRVGLPNYDTPDDITDKVSRTALNESRNYTAAADGFVLFQTNRLTADCILVGYVNEVEVFKSGYRTGTGGDYFSNNAIVPVRKGDIIDFAITTTDSSTLVVQTEPKVIFYPLVGAEHTEGEGPIEYPVFEHAFTDTTDNPFIGTSIPLADALTITSAKIENLCGRSNIDLSTCNISLKIDVFTPKKNGSTVVVDGNGFAEINKTYPVYRNEAIVYCDADNSPAHYYNDYSRHLDVSIVGGVAKIAWTEAFKKDPAANSVAASFTLPALSSLLETNTGKTSWDDFNNSYGKFIDVASDLGLSDCYIRLTAVIDPCTKIINQTISKAGMFIDGEINVDDNGSVCKTPVTYTTWAANGNATDGYTYEYTVKTDCWFHADYLVNVSAAVDKVSVLVNGQEICSNCEDNDLTGSNECYDRSKRIGMPLKRGTKVEFHSINQPVYNLMGDTTNEDFVSELYAIKIIEFKMSTELTPAKFPSLAVRICDVDCREEYTGQDSGGTAVIRALPSTTGTGAYVSWTETQFRNIFGSAFDFDHAKFDVTAVFYVGSSANDYDAATNKLEDTGIEVSLSNQGQQIRPFVVTDIVNGERVAKLSLPGIAYFCSNVAYDTTDGFKLVPRTDGAHIGIGDGGNNLIGDFSSNGKKVRMRLLLHVSDRRGEMADGGRIPNGIASTSKMVRQADMNLVPTASGASYTYSNEITITESGWCIIHANYDNDGNILNGTTTYSVQIQALISNVWTDVAMQDNKSMSSSINTDSGWDFAFPVEASLKLRARTNFGNDGTGLTDYKSGTYPYTRRQQALCWVIPTSKYLAPEYNLPGSAGVIDGSVWKDANGNDLVTNITPDTTVKEITYNVKNDCYLMIALYNTDIGDGSTNDCRECIDIVVNGAVAGCLPESNQNGTSGYESNVYGINVARGSVVKLQHHQNNGTTVYNLFGGVGSGNSNPKLNGLLTFTEFKLRATNVVAAMPDWNTDKHVDINSGDSVTADGWIVITRADNSSGTCSINGVTVFNANVTTNANNNCATVPVSKGDVVTFSGAATAPTVTFYPVKMHEVPTTSASAIEVIAMSSRSVAPSWWKVYSNGWCEQGGQATPTYQTGSTVHIPIQMNDTSYNCSCVCSGANEDWGNTANEDIDVRTVNSISIICHDAASSPSHPNNKVFWEIKGWISEETLLAIKNGTYTFFPGQI